MSALHVEFILLCKRFSDMMRGSKPPTTLGFWLDEGQTINYFNGALANVVPLLQALLPNIQIFHMTESKRLPPNVVDVVNAFTKQHAEVFKKARASASNSQPAPPACTY